MINPKSRFSSRVGFYAKARPSYPTAILDVLSKQIGFAPTWTVADIGSGTGIFTRLLLSNDNTVIAVEPNAPMREAAEGDLGGNPKFHSCDGCAESTGLADKSIDLITAAQAFHWFDATAAAKEFSRVSRTGWVCLVWNQRAVEADAFGSDYEKFQQRFSSRGRQDHRAFTKDDAPQLRRFMPTDFSTHNIANPLAMDFARLTDYVGSTSHMPLPTDETYPQMIEALRELFVRHAKADRVTLNFDTRVFPGRVTI